MSEPTLADRLRELADEYPLESSRRIHLALADEVEELVDQNNDELRFKSSRRRDRIAKLSATPYAARVWENLA
ncbi:hypothetical protein LCGC14_2260000, partial [marine sediment metagenome]